MLTAVTGSQYTHMPKKKKLAIAITDYCYKEPDNPKIFLLNTPANA